MDRHAFLIEEALRWDEICSLFGRIDPERFEEPGVTTAGWSPKDTMSHVGAWTADCGRQLERMHAGTFDPNEETREEIERRNVEWFERSRAMDRGDVRVTFAASRQRMVERFGSLPEVTPQAREWFEESGALHYLGHVRDLQAWLASRP